MPFINCPECGKLNSIKLKNCPKCEAPLDAARAAYYNTQSPQSRQTEPVGQPAWGQPAQQPQSNHWGQPQQPQNNPWGQPQPTPRPQDNPWTQQQQPQSNPWGQPQPTPRPQDNPWTQQQQPQSNPWGQPQPTPRPQENPWTQQQQPQSNPWGQPQHAQPAPAQQQGTICPSCGARLQNGARFCGACGAPIPAQAPAAPGIPTRKNPYSL